MVYAKHFVQFNDLVFDEVGMVEEDGYSVSVKSFDSSYGFTHGRYYPLKRKGGLFDMGRVSFSLTLRMLKLPCEDRPFYIRFAKRQLTTQGRLWAVQDNTLVWAWAVMSSYRDNANRQKDEIEIDVSFDLPEGVWHKANTLRTFLVPHDVCDFMDCYGYHDVVLCKKDCCDCGPKEPAIGDCYRDGEGCCGCGNMVCCECDDLSPDDALCYHPDLLQSLYDVCGHGYKIVYSCDMARKHFTDFLSDDHVGQKLCNKCGESIVGNLYSDTDIPTEGVKITLHGTMHNPMITINGNANIIKGDYDGVLEIHPDGSVYAYPDDCECDTPLPVDVWVVPQGMAYGWTIEQGNNRVVIDSGACCHLCAWIEVDALTI